MHARKYNKFFILYIYLITVQKTKIRCRNQTKVGGIKKKKVVAIVGDSFEGINIFQRRRYISLAAKKRSKK